MILRSRDGSVWWWNTFTGHVVQLKGAGCA
jgi:hypothetical protein